MDHAGDMARYIQEGFLATGRKGIVGWNPDDPATHQTLVDHNEWVYDEETGKLTLAFIWGHEAPFTITIEPQ